MACRVGMTKNLSRRRGEWEDEHPSLRNWKMLDSFFSRQEAQQAENLIALRHGCVAYPGGRESGGLLWHLYHFEYDPLEDLRLQLRRRRYSPL